MRRCSLFPHNACQHRIISMSLLPPSHTHNCNRFHQTQPIVNDGEILWKYYLSWYCYNMCSRCASAIVRCLGGDCNGCLWFRCEVEKLVLSQCLPVTCTRDTFCSTIYYLTHTTHLHYSVYIKVFTSFNQTFPALILTGNKLSDDFLTIIKVHYLFSWFWNTEWLCGLS